jgi:hypothetical protein
MSGKQAGQETGSLEDKQDMRQSGWETGRVRDGQGERQAVCIQAGQETGSLGYRHDRRHTLCKTGNLGDRKSERRAGWEKDRRNNTIRQPVGRNMLAQKETKFFLKRVSYL